MDNIRVNHIKKALRAANLDALILRLPENIVMCGEREGFQFHVYLRR